MEYLNINSYVKTHYAYAYVDYPYAMMVLDKDLRGIVAGRRGPLQKLPDELRSISVVKTLLRFYYKVAAKKLNASKRGSVIFDLPRFSDARQAIADEVVRRGDFPLENIPVRIRNFLDIARIKKIPLISIALESWRVKLLLRKISSIGILSALNESHLMGELNEAVLVEVEFLRIILKKLKVKTVFLTQDNFSKERVICYAASCEKIRTAVIAHGYVQAPHLISICPIRADNLVVWTEEQLDWIGKRCSSEDKRKLVFWGFPKYFRPKKEILGFLSNVLVVFGRIGDDSMSLVVLRNLLSLLKEKGIPFRVRFHPKERDAFYLQNVMREFSVVDSRIDLDRELEWCRVVVGSNTSVLIEAKAFGRRVVQLSELQKMNFENIDSLDVQDVPDYIASTGGGQRGFEKNSKSTFASSLEKYFDASL